MLSDSEGSCEKLGARLNRGGGRTGKSTLLRLLMGKEKPRHGRAEIVASNAVMQYFEQDQANALPLDKTVLQTLEDAS
eukprot:3334445-Pleurochrysis_carterae.AAC.3